MNQLTICPFSHNRETQTINTKAIVLGLKGKFPEIFSSVEGQVPQRPKNL